MADATLAITATVTGGGTTRDIELQQLHRAVDMAQHAARKVGGGTSSGSVKDGNASATWSYTPVATK